MLAARSDRPRAEEAPLSDPSPDSDAAAPRPPWLLLLGAAVGLAVATVGLLEDRRAASTLPDATAAVVGDRVIRRVDYLRVLAGVESDLRNPVDEALRAEG